jgi:oligopeptide/dipeptide ABC transporter ATP-binding protein
MYLGKIIEVGPLEKVFRMPKHPYTRALLAAVPVPDPRFRRTEAMPRGEIPNPINPPGGCRFHPRCPFTESNCSQVEPTLKQVEDQHYAACHLAN